MSQLFVSNNGRNTGKAAVARRWRHFSSWPFQLGIGNPSVTILQVLQSQFLY